MLRGIQNKFVDSAGLGFASIIVVSATASVTASAHDVTEWLSAGALVAAVGQCRHPRDGAGAACRGGVPLQLEASLHPTEGDELFVKLGFAAGNGLNRVSPFMLAAWASDLNEDLTDINGRYNHVLNAWYKHSFRFGNSTLGITGGIIDAADYLDDNAYANDEFGQFMNETMVNGPTSFVPSYDIGGAVEFDQGPWSLRAVVMNVGENDDGNTFTFAGGQLGYTYESSLGEGTYRVYVVTGSKDFLDPTGTMEQRRLAVGLSFDQQLGESLGAWLRFGWQDNSAAVHYEALYSGGFNFAGGAWGRPADDVGIGYSYLDGGNVDVSATQVLEVYYRLGLGEHFAVSADIQFVLDNHATEADVREVLFGLRATAEF